MKEPLYASTHAILDKLALRLDKIGARLDKVALNQDRTDAQLAKTDRKLRELGVLTGNMSNNQGDIAEYFFYHALSDRKTIAGIKYDEIEANVRAHVGKGVAAEYDIVLYNGNSLCIIEVKQKLHPNDITPLLTNIARFKQLFRGYDDYKIYGGVASLCYTTESEQSALENGLLVLKQKGELVEVKHKGIRALA